MQDPVICQIGDPRCADPEFAADNPGVCPDAPTIIGLRVDPSAGEVEVGSKYPFTAYLMFSDGREKNVTLKADWRSSNALVASVDNAGVCTGVAVGVVTIDATYRKMFDFAQLTVISQCFQVGLDIVLVCDRSMSMVTPNEAGETRMEALHRAAKALVDNCIFTKDQVAVVSYAGIYETNLAGVVTKKPDATLHLVLSPSKPEVLGAIESIQVNQPCDYIPVGGGQGSRCATSLGAGLQAAKAELESPRSRAGVRKLVVLMTDGLENICEPNPVVLANEMKAKGWVIAVVALAVPDNSTRVCGGPTNTAHAYLRGLSACGLFYPAADAGSMTDIFSRMTSIICHNQNDPCFYYFPPPSGNPPPSGQMRDAYDYVGFTKWNVIDGFVDLIGVELWPNLQPGHGLFVDMIGTNVARYTKPWESASVATPADSTLGTIETKTAFTLGAARYRLSFQLAGNNRVPARAQQMHVSVGALLDRVINIGDSFQPFTDYTYDFSGAAAASGKIRFQHLNPFPGTIYTGTAGILLDNVKLENLDTGDVLFSDTFDDENPI